MSPAAGRPPARPDQAAASAQPGGDWLVLQRPFFDAPGLEVAPRLLGCVLWHASPEGTVAAVITEVEAYAGAVDPASHAFRGPTARNAVMFGPPGHAYVYFTYGMHFCANLVCEGPGTASAVLLRAGRIVAGAELAAARRPAARSARDYARGPARLCQALDVDRKLDGADVCDPGSPLVVGAPPGWRPARASAISTGPRVGISQAAELPWRFWLTGEPSVSAYRRSVPRHRRGKPVTGTPPGDGTMHR